MSRWKSTFENHHIDQLIQNSLTLLKSIQIENLSPQDLAEYSRLSKVLKFLSARIESLDPELYDLNAWGNFPAWFNNIHSQISTFTQNRNIGHLQNANKGVDEILKVVRTSDTKTTPKEVKAIADANTEFQQKTAEEFKIVKKWRDDFKTQLDSLSNAITQSKARLDENNQIIQQQKTRLDQSIAEFQKQFSDAQEKRSRDFADLLKGNADEFSKQEKLFASQSGDTASQRKNEYENFFEAVRSQSNTHLDFLKQRNEEVDKIFGAIGTAAFAGNFKTTAEKECSKANLLRWIALGLMVIMIAVGGYAFYYSILHDTDWKIFLFRLGTVLIVAVPAFYAANESSKHRERERQNRKIHLELSAIDAYLVLLPEEQRNKIKGSMAEKFFGVPDVKENADDVTRKDLFGVISNMVSNLSKGK